MRMLGHGGAPRVAGAAVPVGLGAALRYNCNACESGRSVRDTALRDAVAMKSVLAKIFAASLLFAAAFGASAQRYAPQEFDFSELPCMGDYGIVESVREVPVVRDMHAFDPEVLELKMNPDMVREVVIRLDGGHVLTVTQSAEGQPLAAGQNVRVILTTSGPIVSPR